MTSTAPQITTLDELTRHPSVEIGAVVNMDYTQAVIVANEYHIKNAMGLPQRSFLIAVPDAEGDDTLEQAVLLSVESVAPLEVTRAYQSLREELAVSRKSPDSLTKGMLQNMGFYCTIVGTFYRNEAGQIQFGGDIDRVLGGTNYKVYKPRGRALALIASHSNDHSDDPKGALSVGVVRYSETQASVDKEAQVFVNVEDFLGAKTFVAGITRAGKSNTMKIIINKVFDYTHQPGRTPVGQIIFDPQGEYANTNSQDGTAIADIGGEDDVRIYKMLSGKKTNPKERHLQFNLFEEHNLALMWELMLAELRSGISSEANYIAPLFDLSFTHPGSQATSEVMGGFRRRQLALYALTSQVKWDQEVKDFSLYVGGSMARKMADRFQEILVDEDNDARIVLSSTQASRDAFLFLREHSNELPQWWQDDFENGTLQAIARQFDEMEEGRNGLLGAFFRIKALHNPAAEGDARDKIWEDLKKGRLVVVDLSKGSSQTTTRLSEMIVHRLVRNSSELFTRGEKPIPFQIVVEEAHNLFRREGVKDDSMDPWVRLSKEAAKYHIGLLYATQEVTSVDAQILSNTVNWVIGHLNSRGETNELGKYYSFKDWGDHLRKVETKGFVRMKTKSSPFVVPVQIEKFDARKAEERFLTPSAKGKPAMAASEPDEFDLGSMEDLF